jgi:23S rRNA pseudouridine2605 synthase
LPDGARALPARVWVERQSDRGAWVRVVMREGRKRQIRETARLLGLQVRRLVRVRMDGIELGSLKPGEWRMLTPGEVQRLRRSTRVPEAGPPRKPPVPRRRRMEA